VLLTAYVAIMVVLCSLSVVVWTNAMHVSLTPELESIIQAKVKSGYYSNASEVIRDAIRRLHEQDSLSGQLKIALQAGMQSIQQGNTVPYDMNAIRQQAEADDQQGKSINPDVTA